MIDTLLIFGDSWPYGSGLAPEQKPYGQVLAELLNIKNFKNFAIPATSNSRNLWELLRYLESVDNTKNTAAVFFITAPGRNMLVQWGYKIVDINMTHSRIDDIINPTTLNEIYYKHLHTVPQEEFDLKRNILAIQRICEQKQIKDFYIIGWSDFDFNCPGIDISKIYKQTCVQILGYKNQQDYLEGEINEFLSPCKHPNQEGHKLIANVLAEWIK